MKKIYVLDTNVLIQAPYALDCFEDNDVVLPLVVLEELDSLKKAEGERGANARAAIRRLENFRCLGNLLDGVPMAGGGTLRVEKNCIDVPLPEDLISDKPDNRILKVCLGLLAGSASDSCEKLNTENKGARDEAENPSADSGHVLSSDRVILVSKDIVLRLKAQIAGIRAEDFTTEQISRADAAYTGRTEVFLPEELTDTFHHGSVPLSCLYQCGSSGEKIVPEFTENEFLILHADQSVNKTLLGRVEGDHAVPLIFDKYTPYGISPRSAGQYFLQEALMTGAEHAPLVIVKGMAGTAKTFYSLAVGLEKVYNNPTGEYRRIIVCRPNAQFDDDIGFLPGDEQEKIAPLMRPVIDNLEQILDSDDSERYADETILHDKIDEIFDRRIIQTEAMNFIRGRSIVKTYLIIDEAQNTTPNQIKGIITRAGRGTKIILLGDPDQIDRPYLDERTNGLSYAAKCMKGSPLCWQLTMRPDECERSPLAADAILRLRHT